MKSVKRGGTVLRIRLQRARWELQKRSDGLENISSELIIAPVISVKWQSKSSVGSKGKFFVRDVYLADSIWDATDRAEVVLSGFGRNPTQLRIVVQDPFKVRLRDIQRKK